MQRLGAIRQFCTAEAVRSRLTRHRHEDLKLLDEIMWERTPMTTAANDLLASLSARALSQAMCLLSVAIGREEDDVGFAVEVAASQQGQAAGQGLFLGAGEAKAGTVVALYGGTSMYAEELAAFGGAETIFTSGKDEHLIHRQDGVLLDGCGTELVMNAATAALCMPSNDGWALDELTMIERLREQQTTARAAEQRRANPFAQAQFANHAGNAPRGANVIPIAVDFDLGLIRELALQDVLPVRHALRSQSRLEAPSPHSVAFVTCRDVEAGEEILLDYATALPRPEWYEEPTRLRIREREEKRTRVMM